MLQKYGSHIALAALIALVGWMIYQNQVNTMRGNKATEFALPVLDSQDQLGPQDFDGTVLLIDFWATYCGPCAETMPDLQALYIDYERADFDILSVNVDPVHQRSLTEVRRWQRSFGLQFPIVLDPGQVALAYNVSTIPHFVLVDRDGRVRYVHSTTPTIDRLRREIDQLVGGS